MSSALRHRTCGARAGRLVILAAGSGLALMDGRRREGSDDLPRPTCRRTVTAPALRESSSGGARTGVREPRESWVDHYEGRSFRGWNHHVVQVLVCFAFIAPSAPGLSPSAGKNATRKASHRHDGADGTRRTALPGFLHHCAPAVARPSWPTGTPMPVSQTAIDGTAGAHAVNTDGDPF